MPNGRSWGRAAFGFISLLGIATIVSGLLQVPSAGPPASRVLKILTGSLLLWIGAHQSRRERWWEVDKRAIAASLVVLAAAHILGPAVWSMDRILPVFGRSYPGYAYWITNLAGADYLRAIVGVMVETWVYSLGMSVFLLFLIFRSWSIGRGKTTLDIVQTARQVARPMGIFFVFLFLLSVVNCVAEAGWLHWGVAGFLLFFAGPLASGLVCVSLSFPLMNYGEKIEFEKIRSLVSLLFLIWLACLAGYLAYSVFGVFMLDRATLVSSAMSLLRGLALGMILACLAFVSKGGLHAVIEDMELKISVVSVGVIFLSIPLVSLIVLGHPIIVPGGTSVVMNEYGYFDAEISVVVRRVPPEGTGLFAEIRDIRHADDNRPAALGFAVEPNRIDFGWLETKSEYTTMRSFNLSGRFHIFNLSGGSYVVWIGLYRYLEEPRDNRTYALVHARRFPLRARIP